MREFQLLKPSSRALISTALLSNLGPSTKKPCRVEKAKTARKSIDLLLTFRMEIYPAHRPLDLIEADVVKPFETGAHDLTHTVVRHKEGFLPAHENVLTLRAVLVMEVGLLGLFCERAPGGESAPVLHVCVLCRAPRGVTCLEGVSRSNDFAFEVGCQGWVVFSQPWSRLCGKYRIFPRAAGFDLPSMRK